MSNGGSSSGNGREDGPRPFPPKVKKVLQSLKEIVKNSSDEEIYAMLKECNMDPNDAIQRLLSQDTFHEVKSKRDKRKEKKGNTESRFQAMGNTSNRGSRTVSDGNTGATQFSSSESGVISGKPVYKKESGANHIPSYSASARKNINHTSSVVSSLTSRQIPEQMGDILASTSDFPPVTSQPANAIGYKPAWLGVPGQLSMADVVKMGKSDSKGSSKPFGVTETSYSMNNTAMPSVSKQRVKHIQASKPLQSEDHRSKNSLMVQEPSSTLNQQISSEDWPLSGLSPAARSSVSEPSTTSAVYADPSIRRNLQEQNGAIEIPTTNCNEFASSSDIQRMVDFSEQDSFLHDSSLKDENSCQTQILAFEYPEGTGGSMHASVSEYRAPSSVEDVGVAVSLVASSLQQLTFHNDELAAPPKEDNRAVIIPEHLQVTTADCSHLSFGSFGSGVSATFVSKTLDNNFEESSGVADGSSSEQSDTRNPEYYDEEQVIFASTTNNASPSPLQPEIKKFDSSEQATNGNQYSIPSSMPGYAFENAAQTDAVTESYAQAGSHLQKPAPFSTAMHLHTNPQSSHQSESAVQPVQESGLPYLRFTTTQSMPTKYSSQGSSIGDQAISMQEAMKQSIFSMPQPQQSMLSNSMPTGPTLPQHLPMHPLTQPALPLGHFPNMVGYPYLPQSYTFLPSVFQQAYATASSAYSHSPVALQNADVKYSSLQYKNNAPVRNVPQSVSSFYGGFGGLTNNLGNSTPNPSNISPSASIGYEGVIGTQFKASNNYMLQQNEGSGMWVQGPGSRTMSVLPASTYYNLNSQSQQHGVRHGQQPSQYGAMGYSNFSHSQTGISQEHQQTLGNGTLNAPQAHPGQQLQQIWQ